MTGIVAIDESGDLGRNGSRFFVISAVMSARSRNLLRTSKMIDNRFFESKYRNTSKENVSELLRSLVNSGSVITYVAVDKYDFNSPFYNVYGNALYQKALKKLIERIDKSSPANEVKIIVDSTFSMSQTELNAICARTKRIKVVKQTKTNSSSNKCVQIADFVAGTIWHRFEKNDFEHYLIIEKVIRCP